LKEVRIALEAYACGAVKPPCRYIRLNYAGIPVILKEASHHFKTGNTYFRSMVLSVLSVGRTAKFQKCPDYSTVTGESTRTVDIPIGIYDSFIKHLASLSSQNLKRIPHFGSFHFSNRASPLGDNCMESMMVELASLPPDILSAIYDVGGPDIKFRINFILSNFSKICSAIPNFKKVVSDLIDKFRYVDGFITPFDIYDKNDDFYVKFLSQYIRKMVSFAEYEGKTRIIGLCEYWSQVALEPLASLCFNILDSIPQDQTFGQADGCKELTFSSSVTYHSLDLSAFTDRFPMQINSTLLARMFSPKYSSNVTKILCSVPF